MEKKPLYNNLLTFNSILSFYINMYTKQNGFYSIFVYDVRRKNVYNIYTHNYLCLNIIHLPIIFWYECSKQHSIQHNNSWRYQTSSVHFYPTVVVYTMQREKKSWFLRWWCQSGSSDKMSILNKLAV